MWVSLDQGSCHVKCIHNHDNTVIYHSVDLFCEPNPCENGGECCEDFGVCVCPCAFEGPMCETGNYYY